jgi:hypothetical protein
MIELSVALPVWNSKKIAWLPMESLCRQLKPTCGWELVIFEESHSEQLGEEFFRGYEERLKEVGCERMHYMTSQTKYPLPQKWVMISQETDVCSRGFIMCAADNHYHQWMLQDMEEAIKVADWCLITKGYFYDFNLDKVIKYSYPGLVGLFMTASTPMVRKFEKSNLERGVDGWFCEQMKKQAHGQGVNLRCFIDGSDHWQHQVNTNGLNNISTGRVVSLEREKHPFYKTDTKLQDIVPEDIYRRMMYITNSMQTNDDLA